MKLIKVLENINYKSQTDISINEIEVTDVVIDSRNVIDGSMFVCITGLTVNGHDYIESAINNGAKVIVIEKDQLNYNKDICYIKVNDTRVELSHLSSNFYNTPSDKFNLIGVTGTNGKTSTTYFIDEILKNYGQKTGVLGTTGARINGELIEFETNTSTTPDAHHLQKLLAQIAQHDIDTMIMEVTSQALDQKRVHGLKFEVALFTNITQDHLDYHISMDNYLQAKLKLFEMSKYAVVNVDDSYSDAIIKMFKGKIITYSIDKESDLKALNIKYKGDSISFDLFIDGTLENVIVNVPGKFTVYNVLGTIGVAMFLKIPFNKIKEGLLKIEGVPGRIQSVPNELGVNVLVDYAHSPDGLLNIINAVREFTSGRVITIFGCGGDRDKTKRPIMGKIAGDLSDYCIITSDNPRTEDESLITKDIEIGVIDSNCNYEIKTDRKEAINKGIKIAKSGDSVIIAGKGHEDYQIFKNETIHFSDYEVAKEILWSLKK